MQEHEEYQRYHDGVNVTLLCIVTSVKLKTTKSNATMAFVQIEDMYGSIEMLVFPQILAECGQLIKEGTVVQVYGRVSAREEEDAKIVCNRVLPSDYQPTSENREAQKKKGNRNGPIFKAARDAKPPI